MQTQCVSICHIGRMVIEISPDGSLRRLSFQRWDSDALMCQYPLWGVFDNDLSLFAVTSYLPVTSLEFLTLRLLVFTGRDWRAWPEGKQRRQRRACESL